MIKKLVLSCKKATELIEKKQLVTLDSKEKIQLILHKKMCKICSTYEKQSELIEKVLENQFKHRPDNVSEKLTDDEKNQMIQRLLNNPE